MTADSVAELKVNGLRACGVGSGKAVTQFGMTVEIGRVWARGRRRRPDGYFRLWWWFGCLLRPFHLWFEAASKTPTARRLRSGVDSTTAMGRSQWLSRHAVTLSTGIGIVGAADVAFGGASLAGCVRRAISPQETLRGPHNGVVEEAITGAGVSETKGMLTLTGLIARGLRGV